jgi:hypothetical protein
MKRLLLLLLLLPSLVYAQGGKLTQDPAALTRQGYPAGGVNVAVCQPLATTGAQVTSNLVVFTMASNPVTAGFVDGMTVQVAGFTGFDTYLNNGTLNDGQLTGGLTILSVTPTTIIVALTHANAAVGSNGTLLQIGNAATPCAGLSTLYTDVSLTVTQSNPFQADGLGNYSGAANPGVYYVQLYGSGVTTTLRQIVVACSPTGNNCGTGGGGGSLSGMTAGQVPIAATSTTVTSSKAIQGSDPALLSSGTIAGVSVQLCTDANGGATTVSCPSGLSGQTPTYLPKATSVNASNTSSSVFDIGTEVGTTEPFEALNGIYSSAAPGACNSPASGCFVAGELPTPGTPTAGIDYIKADSNAHRWKMSNNGGAETTIPTITNQSQYSVPVNLGATANDVTGAVCPPPSTNGTYVFLYAITGGVIGAPSCPNVGLAVDEAANANVLYSDNNIAILNPNSSLVIPNPLVAVSSSGLGNPNFFTILINNGSASTLTPTTFSIAKNGGSSGSTAVVNPHSQCSMLVDQNTPILWDLTCVSEEGYLNGVTLNSYFASPPAIGGTAPAAMTSTTTTVTGGNAFGISGQLGQAACETTFGITTLSGASTSTGLNCLPANSIILAIEYRITTTITTATSFTIGDSGSATRYCGTQSTLTSGTTGYCSAAGYYFNASAAAVKVTPSTTPGAGAIRLTVTYLTFTAPTS